VILTWIVAELGTVKFRRFKSSDDFGLSQDELVELGDFQREEQVVSGNLARASKKVASLEKMGLGLRRNKNGDFDGRSKLGKKLNRELPRARALVFQHQNQFDAIEEQVSQFDKLPKSRAEIWVKAESFRVANRIVLVMFTTCLIFYAMSGYPIANYWMLVVLVWATLLYLTKKVQRASLNAKLGI
tara:strand:+ start:588 stop:1145 length:558 start_codon:yes stop_codon:yes gene_type:complete